MARGWESKSVEGQMEVAAEEPIPERNQSEIDRELKSKRNSLMISRSRVMHDMESSQSVRYKDILAKGLADLDQKIAELK
jgi:hypothetical protein